MPANQPAKQAKIQIVVDGADKAIGQLRGVSDELVTSLASINDRLLTIKETMLDISKTVSPAFDLLLDKAEQLANVKPPALPNMPAPQDAPAPKSSGGGRRTKEPDPLAGNKVADVARLGKTIGGTYDEAQNLANELGMTAKQTTVAVNAFRQLEQYGANAATAMKALSAELNITEEQFAKIAKVAASVPSGDSGLFGQLRKLTGLNVKEGLVGISFGFNQITMAIQGVVAIARPAYELLIGQNEKLSQQLLRSQTSLAASTEQYDQFGQKITDITAKIRSTRGALKEAILQVEKDTRELVGVTSAQVNESFNIVLENSRALVGQSQKSADTIDNARRLTKGLVAAIGTIGLPLEQVRQEFRALVTGDLNNPDARLAQTLQITKSQFEQAKAQGKLIDFLEEKFQVYIKGNAEAARSVSGILSNITSLYEETARVLGEPLLDPILDGLKQVETFLLGLEDQIKGGAAQAGKQLGDIFRDIGGILQSTFTLIKPTLEGLAKTLLTTGKIALDGIRAVVFVLDQALKGVVQLRDTLYKTIPGLEALSKFNLGDVLGGAQKLLFTLGGGAKQSREALEEYGRASDEIAKRSNAVLGDLAQFQGKNEKELTKQEQDKLKAAKIRGSVEQANIAAQIAQLKELTIVYGEDDEQRKNQIALLEQYQAKLKEAGAGTGVTLGAKDLEKLGGTLEVLKQRSDSAFKQIQEGAGGDKVLFDQLTESAGKYVQQLVELGGISLEQARAQLESLATDERIEPEKRLAFAKQLQQLDDIALQRKQQLVAVEDQLVKTQLATGQIDAKEASLRNVQNQATAAQGELEVVQAKLATAQKLGNAADVEKFSNEVKKLQLRIDELNASAEDIKLENKIKDAEKAFKKAGDAAELSALKQEKALALSKSAAGDTEAQVEGERLAIEEQRSQAELNALDTKLKALEASKGQFESAEKNKEVEQQIVDAQKQQVGLQTKLIKLAGQRALQQADIVKAKIAEVRLQQDIARTVDEIGLKQKRNAEQINGKQFDAQQASAARKRAEQEAKLAAQTFEGLSKIAKPKDRQSRLKLEKQVNEARLDAFKKQSELLDAQQAEEQKQNELRLFELDGILQKRQQEGQLVEANVQRENTLRQLVTDSLSRQAELSQAKVNLEQATLNLLVSQSERRQQSLQESAQLLGDLEKAGAAEKEVINKRLQEKGISERGKAAELEFRKQALVELQNQLQLEQQGLIARQQAEQTSSRLEAEQRQLAAQNAVFQAEQAKITLQLKQKELELEIEKAKLSDDPEVRRRAEAAANQAASLNEQAISLQDKQISAAQQALAITQEVLKAKQDQLDVEQQIAREQFDQNASSKLFNAERETAKFADQSKQRFQSPLGSTSFNTRGPDKQLAERTIAELRDKFRAPDASAGLANNAQVQNLASIATQMQASKQNEDAMLALLGQIADNTKTKPSTVQTDEQGKVTNNIYQSQLVDRNTLRGLGL